MAQEGTDGMKAGECRERRRKLSKKGYVEKNRFTKMKNSSGSMILTENNFLTHWH